MPTVLLTAFEPYDRWPTNASWLTVVELTKERPAEPQLTTRLYPVDFRAARTRLEEDLKANYDYAIHLGQAPGSAHIRLEAIGLNVGGSIRQLPEEYQLLAEDGPVAYQSPLPLGDWAAQVRKAGVPAHVSYHAGTFLCNAVLYLSQYFTALRGYKTQSCFVHLPLSTAQAVGDKQDLASLPTTMAATALRVILGELARS